MTELIQKTFTKSRMEEAANAFIQACGKSQESEWRWERTGMLLHFVNWIFADAPDPLEELNKKLLEVTHANNAQVHDKGLMLEALQEKGLLKDSDTVLGAVLRLIEKQPTPPRG